MDKFLDLTGLTEYDQLIKNYVDSKSSGNSFGNISVDSTTISADSATDTLTIEAGDNITITPDETNNKITISSSGGTSYTLPVATSSALGGVKSGTDITVDSSGNVSVNDDSHNHVISNVDGLQSALDEKLNNSRYYFSDHNVYRCLGTATLRQSGDYLLLRIVCGDGFNASVSQDRMIDVHLRTSNGNAVDGKYYAGYIESHFNGATNCNIYIVQNSSTSFTIWIGKLNYPGNSFYDVYFPSGASWTTATETSSSIPTNGVELLESRIAYVGTNGCLYSNNKLVTTTIYSSTEPTSNLDTGTIWIG